LAAGLEIISPRILTNTLMVNSIEPAEKGIYLGNAFFSGGITVGSKDKPAGITLYDTETGEPFCMKITRGSLVNVPGECVSLPDFLETQENPEAQPSEPSESLAPSEASEPSEPSEPTEPSEANPELNEVINENPADELTEPIELIEQPEPAEQPGTPPSEIVTEPVEASSEPQPAEPIPETSPDLTPSTNSEQSE
jgi:hypothetical protein